MGFQNVSKRTRQGSRKQNEIQTAKTLHFRVERKWKPIGFLHKEN
jgi:hypothetical protein